MRRWAAVLGVVLMTVTVACVPAPGGSPAPGPVITSVDPGSGPAIGGNTVTIYGSGFGVSPTVTFDGVAATGVSGSDTMLDVTAPPGSGLVEVVVTAGGSVSNAVSYQYL